MKVRRFVPVSLLLAAVALASAVPARAQPGAGRERRVARGWRTAGADSMALDRLFQATLRTGGAQPFDAVLAAARDAERPQLVRIYALAALLAYARPEFGENARVVFAGALDAGVVCAPSPMWTSGDTLRACLRVSNWGFPPVRPGAPAPPAPPAALSADSARMEAIVAVARAIARCGRSPVAGAADLMLSRLGPLPNVRSVPAIACPASYPPLPSSCSSTVGVFQERVDPPAEATQGPALVNACTVSRHLVRNYPPLSRDAGEEGTVVLSLLVGPDGVVREASVEHAAPRPEFGVAALRIVSRMSFAPARRDGTPVAARVSLPIRFAFAGEYPRVANP